MAHILVIDDEEMVRMIVARALERDGHTVTEAVDGNDGLRKYRESEADLVIIDMLMPGKEGTGTIVEFRAMKKDLPIIAISGGTRQMAPNSLDVALELGANVVLKKPFRLHEIRELANDQLGL